MASSGIAALLLDGGRTAHSRFRIPINIHERSYCHIKVTDQLAKLIINCKVIIWDEAVMGHKHIFECVDRSFRDIMGSIDKKYESIVFGGKVMLLGGDFRQILPVVNHGSRADIVRACIKNSFLWNYVNQLKLTKNMRLISNSSDDKSIVEYDKFLIRIGDGKESTNQYGTYSDCISIPDNMLIKIKKEQLIESVWPELQDKFNDSEYIINRAVLSPKNSYVDTLNDYLTEKFPGELVEYLSATSISSDAESDAPYSTEFVNSLSISSNFFSNFLSFFFLINRH